MYAEHPEENAKRQDDRDIAGAKLKTLLKICVALECRLEDIVTDEETLTLIAAYKG